MRKKAYYSIAWRPVSIIRCSLLFFSSFRSSSMTSLAKSVAALHVFSDDSICRTRFSGVIAVTSVLSSFRLCVLNLRHVKNTCFASSSSPRVYTCISILVNIHVQSASMSGSSWDLHVFGLTISLSAGRAGGSICPFRSCPTVPASVEDFSVFLFFYSHLHLSAFGFCADISSSAPRSGSRLVVALRLRVQRLWRRS